MTVDTPQPTSDRAAVNGGSAPDIVLLEEIHPAADVMLEREGLRVGRLSGALNLDDAAPSLEGVKVLGIRSKSQVTAAVLDRCPDLLGVGCFCIGTNQVDLTEACRRGVAVFNAPFSNTRSVAELTIAEIIGLHRRLFDKSMGLHRGEWDKSAQNAHEVRGRTIGIVGYGHIGSQVSVLAEALGMHVIYYDISAKLPLGNARPVDTLDALLETADVVTLHVPATPLTEGLIGAAELERMRPDAFLINNARGSVVDLEALSAAIAGGRLRGAALDVYPEEPKAAHCEFTCALAGQPNVILTPHIGGSTEEAQEAIARDVAQKLARYLHNGTTTSAVNVPEVQLPLLRPDQHRILHIHHNVPGVLSKMHGILADLGVNINAEHLQSNAEVSYVILDVDPHHGEAVEDGLAAIEETIRMRRLY
ncbi:MAG: phosphoglycerate dehydrogenase [Planctomycetota bacterium]|jgi:D-3-phosphoglycerate dehydrogenase